MKKFMILALVVIGLGMSLYSDTTELEKAEKAYESGDAKGYFNEGNMYYIGQGVKQDYNKARAFYKKACDGGDSISCYNRRK